jgi:hypothetical protein
MELHLEGYTTANAVSQDGHSLEVGFGMPYLDAVRMNDP